MRQVQLAESSVDKVNTDLWRQHFHLMPPVGWLNDPNGSCQFKGKYHIFFQYSPTDAKGGFKTWGHYTSRDLLSWKYEGVTFYPDEDFDKDGVYSGTAYVEDGKMHIFYTGNVKRPGDHDYITSGREADTIYVTSEDGECFSEKEVVIRSAEYPQNYSCHIRDPKVWKVADGYQMLLGARTLEDEGRALLYHSTDLKKWTLCQEIRSDERFGYMWECPDYFELQGSKYIAFCPQGVDRGEKKFQNVYASGYMPIAGDLTGKYQLGAFEEWDYGFDFYAPQSFEDESGRRLFLGWMGLPDIEPEYHNPTVEKGWQHCMTMFRELVVEDGVLYQRPAREYEDLFCKEQGAEICEGKVSLRQEAGFVCRAEEIGSADMQICLAEGLKLSYNREAQEFIMEFENKDLGAGRTIRRVELKACDSMEVYVDTSAVEVYLNGGEKVMGTRFYPDSTEISVEIEGLPANAKVKISSMEA